MLEPTKPTKKGKRETRSMRHIATFTPTAFNAITEQAKAEGISRNEAIQQACIDWVGARQKSTDGKVKVSFPLDAWKKARLAKKARMLNVTLEELLAHYVHEALAQTTKYPDYHHKRRAKKGSGKNEETSILNTEKGATNEQ